MKSIMIQIRLCYLQMSSTGTYIKLFLLSLTFYDDDDDD